MVGIIGTPAEGNLTKVARADNKTADRVCVVHQNLSSLTRLSVFEGDATVTHINSKVLKVYAHRP